MSTLFTKIIDGEIPGRHVWADDQVVAFTTIAPIADGHTLVVPRAEIDQFLDAPDAVLSRLMTVAKIIGRAQRAVWQSPRAALLVAGFEIPHLHLHVLPAWDEESLSFRNARDDVPADQLDDAAVRLRTELTRQGHGAQVPPRLESSDLGG